MSDFYAALQWGAVRREVASHPPRTLVAYPKRSLPHPRDAGARVSAGIPRGQIEDYRFPPEDDCGGLHVQEFDDRWEAHIDGVHPACDAVDHLRVDAPGAWVAAGGALGAAVGILLGRSKAAALAGAGIGALLAALTAGRSGEESRGARRPRAHRTE